MFEEESADGEIYENSNTPEVQFHEHSFEIVELVGKETVWYLDRESASRLAAQLTERLESSEAYVNR